MIHKYAFFIVLFLCSLHVKAGKKLKVLFIGNSYTYVNDLPGITSAIAASAGDTLLYDSYTIGGYKLADHCFDPLCEQKIRSGQWDYVVLQEQSRMPSMQPGSFYTYSYHWAQTLDTLIRSNDICSKTMFYMTWGYKNGDSVYCNAYPSWPYVCTYNGMDSVIRMRYMAYADTSLPAKEGIALSNTGWFQPILPAQVSPVGAVWRYIRNNYPGIELYQTDESHPSAAGSYAGACSFYTALFRKDPNTITYNYTLPAVEANEIRVAARKVVYDSLTKWFIGVNGLRAQFITNSGSGYSLSFVNQSSNAVTFRWDFGDGNTSKSINPTHAYTSPGTYVARLIAYDGKCSDTTYTSLNIYGTEIRDISADDVFNISPNPGSAAIILHAMKSIGCYDVAISSVTGKLVYSQRGVTTADHSIDVGSFVNGLYIVNITGDNVSFRGKFLKQ